MTSARVSPDASAHQSSMIWVIDGVDHPLAAAQLLLGTTGFPQVACLSGQQGGDQPDLLCADVVDSGDPIAIRSWVGRARGP